MQAVWYLLQANACSGSINRLVILAWSTEHRLFVRLEEDLQRVGFILTNSNNLNKLLNAFRTTEQTQQLERMLVRAALFPAAPSVLCVTGPACQNAWHVSARQSGDGQIRAVPRGDQTQVRPFVSAPFAVPVDP